MGDIRLAQGLSPRKRRRKPGDLAALRRVLWSVIVEVEALMDDDGNADPRVHQALTLKAAHALAQLSGAYTRVLEGADLETRIVALEAAVLQGRNRHGA
jgi:hypothetical protein